MSFVDNLSKLVFDLYFIPTIINHKLLKSNQRAQRVSFTAKRGSIELLKKWTYEFLQT
jgi:hypothetical protein